MKRDEMTAKLCLREEGMHLLGGLPTRFVTVGGPADKYADDELALLAEFTEARQAAYHRRCGNAKFDWADNFISFDKEVDDRRAIWGRKRLSWREGRMHAPSLPEALAAFWGDRCRQEAVGDFCLLGTGDLVEIVAAIPYERDREGDFACRRLVDGTGIAISQHQVGVVAAAARSIEALGDLVRMAVAHRIAAHPTADPADVRASRAAVTPSNDPAALTSMWAARVLDWQERSRLPRAA